MKISKYLPLFAVPLLTTLAFAQPASDLSAPPLKARVSWVGNSFSGANGQWVQNFFIHMNTRPDGTCVTWSHWDEGGKKFGQYKDGKVVGDQDVGANSLQATDKRGRTWKLLVDYLDPPHTEYDFTPKEIQCDGQKVSFPGLFEPTALCVANDGTLMIADSGKSPRQQVLFYDVSDVKNPKLVREFGQRGGISAGVAGVVTPLKFWGIRGLGVDAQNNIYVAQSEMGSVLRKFTPQGKLVWEIYGNFFCDLATVDPTTDGADVWGIQEHYKMDFSRAPGQDAKWVGYSLDHGKYPHDPRGLMFVKQSGEHGLTSPQIVYLQGKRFMFVGGMFASNFINIFRYEGEIAKPSSLIMQWDGPLFNTNQKWPPFRPQPDAPVIWRDLNGDGDYQANEYAPNTPQVKPGPFWVDKKGDIWMAYGFFRYDFQGLDAKGNPIYRADKTTKMEMPKGMKNVARVWYDSEADTLVAAEEGFNEEGAADMRHIGRIFVCRDYLKGNRDAIFFTSGAKKETSVVTAAGDYVFSGGWKERARVYVNRLSDGAPVGVFDPGELVGGIENTGWIDVLTGISAFRKKDGEYMVFIEENYKAKSVLYRWKPTP